MSPVVGVLALQGDVTEHLRALEQAGARPLAVRRPTELDEAAGLIIRGGESTTIWKLAETFGLADPLRKRVASGMARRRPLPRRVYPRPWAERVGEDAEVLAVEPRTGKIVAVRQGPALATAFHPELTGDRRIHETLRQDREARIMSGEIDGHHCARGPVREVQPITVPEPGGSPPPTGRAE